jgi:hypothetical protein
MALQCRLFRGDAALEACLISDPAHIVPGSAGNHVAKIQTALKILDRAVIASAELSGKRYGNSTAGAVLAYKKKRNIVNRSSQTQADNIVGKMTVAAMDRELGQFEPPNPGPGVAICRFPPSYTRHRGGGLMLGFAVPGVFAQAAAAAPLPPVPSTGPDPLQHAQPVFPIATGWASAGLTWLRKVRQAYRDHGNSNWPAEPLALFEAVNVHFQLRRLPRVEDQPGHIDKIITNYVNIIKLLGTPDFMGDDPNYYPDPNDPRHDAAASAAIGGFHDPNNKKKVWFHGPFGDIAGISARAAIILHECGHSVASGLHYSYGYPRDQGGTAGEPQKGATGPLYKDMTPDQAIHNADTYSTFAAHASTGDPSPKGDIRPHG